MNFTLSLPVGTNTPTMSPENRHMAKDYYNILGVSKSVDAKELKRAYREKSKECHPDLNPGDPTAEDRFKAVAEAYAVLSDPEKRARFDRYGDVDDRNFAQDINPFDIFESFFGDFFGGGGGGRGQGRANRGQDIQVAVRVSFETAAKGGKVNLDLEDRKVCEPCKGSGAKPGTIVTTCSTCGGQGRVQQIRRTMLGQMSTVTVCPTCQGEGTVIPDPCPSCRGKGLVNSSRQLEVGIPPGIFDGARLRLRQQGLVTQAGGPRGDLYVDIEVASHPVFERDGLEVISEVPIGFVTATLGGVITVPTLEGEREVKIPQGTQPGHNFRLKGLGIPDVNTGRRGDHVVILQIQVPQKLSAKQKDLLVKFDEESEEHHRNPQKSLWERMKEAFT